VTENREDSAMLDRMLEQMAQETPEMPADFHTRWTEAIRAEAGEEIPTEKHREGRRQLRYILSAAAVFIFLIGGTLLTRSMNQTDPVNSPAVTLVPAAKEDAAVPAVEEADKTAFMRPEIHAGMQFNGSDTVYAAEDANTFAAVEEPVGTAEDSAAFMAASSKKSASSDSAKAAGGAAVNTEADMAMGAAMETYESREYAEEADMAMEYAEEEEALLAAASTAVPTATATMTATVAPTVEPTAAPTVAPTAAPAAESEFVSFLKDLGIFTLKTLAVAAAAAALAFGVAAIHKALKKQEKRKG